MADLDLTPPVQDLQSERGDTLRLLMVVEGYDTPSGTWLPVNLTTIKGLRLTVKRSRADPDPGLVQLTLGSGLTVLVAAAGTVRIDLATATLPAAARLYYDIQLDEADDRVSTLVRGSWRIEADATVTVP